MYPAEEPYADRVNRLLTSIAEGVLDEGIIYDCPWDDFRFMYFRGKHDETAARELGAWAKPQGTARGPPLAEHRRSEHKQSLRPPADIQPSCAQVQSLAKK
jgi:hypothetical protein